MNICNDIEVCQPEQELANGNPLNIVSGASTGKVYHHFVNVVNEITVNGITNFNVSCFKLLSIV
jgi:hypothetical protein